MAGSFVRQVVLVAMVLGISQAQTSWFTPTFTDSPNEDGIYWHQSELAYRMGENFQPIIFIEWGTTLQYPGMFLQGNLQFFIRSDAGLTYIGMTNLFNVATGGLHISALRGAEDFYIDIPGCGNQRFTKSVIQLNIGVESLAVTWNIESHASASCPEVFAAIQFPTEEANVAKYLHYRYTKWHASYPGKRSVSGFAVPSGFGDSVCSVSGDQGFVVGGYSG